MSLAARALIEGFQEANKIFQKRLKEIERAEKRKRSKKKKKRKKRGSKHG